MARNLISFAAVAFAAGLTLAGCGGSGEAETQNNLAAAEPPPKEMPPAIRANRIYRCADNSLVYVDYYTDNSAQIRTSQDGAPTRLTAEGGNPPYVAEGYSVASDAERTTIAVPGKRAQSCRSRS